MKNETQCYWLDDEGNQQGPVEWKYLRKSPQSLILPEDELKWKTADYYLKEEQLEQRNKRFQKRHQSHRRPKNNTSSKFIDPENLSVTAVIICILGVLLSIFLLSMVVKSCNSNSSSSSSEYTTERKCKSAARSWLRANLKDQNAEIQSLHFQEEFMMPDDSPGTCHFISAIVIAKNSFGVKLRKRFSFYISHSFTILEAKEH